MPTREINLFRKREILTPDEIKLKKFTRNFLPLILLAFIFLLGGVLYISVSVNKIIADTDQAIVDVRGKINSLKRNESIYLLLKQKAVVLAKILNSRFPYREDIEFFKTLSLNGSTLNSMEIDETGRISLRLNVKDSTHLDALVTALIKEAEKRFRKVELEGVSYTPGNILDISLQIETLAQEL